MVVVTKYMKALAVDTIKQNKSNTFHYPLNTVDVTIMNLTDHPKELFHIPSDYPKLSRYKFIIINSVIFI